ncbi:MAG: hypothetical protein IPI04_16730 [Ignavibacteria bacterium]|nr:hypothetical protein [Ignavibacteria bacterium]
MKDTIRVYIRGSSSPYQIIDSSKAVIDSVTFTANVAAFVPPGSYYFEVKHRNSISVWSSSPVYLEGNVNYDFTASASQAYGNNLFFNGSVYCIYGGDVDRDGIIDASDVSSVDNGANSSAAGYILTDITGDKYTDASDVSIVDNNARNLVSEFTPFTIQAPCNLTCDRFLNWSGFTWCVIGSNDTRCYPGPHYFSSNTDNVRDSTGDLHIKITNRNGRFYCAEMHTVENGRVRSLYIAVSSRIDNLDKNVVLGLFTWNDKNCITNANSELDIEFTRWVIPEIGCDRIFSSAD